MIWACIQHFLVPIWLFQPYILFHVILHFHISYFLYSGFFFYYGDTCTGHILKSRPWIHDPRLVLDSAYSFTPDSNFKFQRASLSSGTIYTGGLLQMSKVIIITYRTSFTVDVMGSFIWTSYIASSLVLHQLGIHCSQHYLVHTCTSTSHLHVTHGIYISPP